MQDKGMEECRKLFCSIAVALFFLCLAITDSAVFAGSEFHLSNELSVTSNDVTGPGSSSSSLTEGARFLEVLGINGNGTVNQFDYSFNVGGKATDDPRNDIKKVSLTNLNFKLTDKIHTVNAGDTFESFSQYSLSTSLKGLSYRFFDEARNSPELTLVYGAAYPRWDSAWRDSKTISLERQAAAARVKYSFTPELSAGFSLVHSEDDRRLSNDEDLYDSNIYEFDIEYRPIPGLTIRTESAFNDTKQSPEEDAAYEETHGYAHRIEAAGDGGPSRVTLEYERVSPDFTALLGSATADREKIKGRWKYKYSKQVNFSTGFLWYRNNLDGQRSSGRADHYKPEIGMTVRNLFSRQYSSADISYKLDLTDENSDTTKADHIVNLNYRDRFGIFDSDTNLGYTSYDTKDEARSKEYTFNTALNSRHTAGAFILKPAVYLGSWTSRNELDDNSDKTYEYSIGLGIDAPHLKITSNIKAGQNKLEKDTPGTDDSLKNFANLSIYYRPEALANLNSGMVFLRANVNDFSYTTGERNFRETSITTGINIQI